MRLLFLVLINSAFTYGVYSQTSDFISVQKRNGRIIKNFGAGSPISLITTSGQRMQAIIKWIRDDSIGLLNYEVRQFGTVYNGIVLDTISVPVVMNYKEISNIQLYRHRGYGRRKLAAIMMVGGTGYLALNAINGINDKELREDKEYVQTLILSAAVSGLGFLLNYRPNLFSRKRHRIVYVPL